MKTSIRLVLTLGCLLLAAALLSSPTSASNQRAAQLTPAQRAAIIATLTADEVAALNLGNIYGTGYRAGFWDGVSYEAGAAIRLVSGVQP